MRDFKVLDPASQAVDIMRRLGSYEDEVRDVMLRDYLARLVHSDENAYNAVESEWGTTAARELQALGVT